MNELLNMRLFGLLSETSQEVTNEELQNAYGEFLSKIEVISCEENYSTTYRTLAATRIELASLNISTLYGQGGKCAQKAVLTKGSGNYQRRTGTVQSENPVPQPVSEPNKQLPILTTPPNRRNLSR